MFSFFSNNIEIEPNRKNRNCLWTIEPEPNNPIKKTKTENRTVRHFFYEKPNRIFLSGSHPWYLWCTTSFHVYKHILINLIKNKISASIFFLNSKQQKLKMRNWEALILQTTIVCYGWRYLSALSQIVP